MTLGFASIKEKSKAGIYGLQTESEDRHGKLHDEDMEWSRKAGLLLE